MTIEFQTSILKYLLQTPNSGQYFQHLDSSIFDLAVHGIAFDVLHGYYKQYGELPTPVTAEKLLRDDLNSTKNMPSGLADELEAMFQDFKVPIVEKDRIYVEDTLILHIQKKKTDQFIMSYGDDKLSLDQLTSKLGQLNLMKNKESADMDGLVIQDRRHHNDDLVDGHPTFLHDLNMMTAAKGFYSPQLIVFASGPKHFKTGFIIKLAVEYARDGYNVYYADGENGKKSIRRRIKQSILECTNAQLRDDIAPEDVEAHIEEDFENFHKYGGGDLFVDYWPAGTATVTDVRNRLAQIKETKGWQPDIIVWDSIDHFLPSKPEDQKRDTRIQIQKVYHEAIALNNDLDTFAIAPSQVNKAAIDKKVFDLKDLSEDFGKVMNAHAVFAICATEEELEQRIRRIVVVVQREGERYTGHNQCVVKVWEDKGKIVEVDKDEYYKDAVDD